MFSTSLSNLEFPERIQNVRSITVSHIEIPLSFYNISRELENTRFVIVVRLSDDTMVRRTNEIPSGFYTADKLMVALNAAASDALEGVVVTFSSQTHFTHVHCEIENPIILSVSLLFLESSGSSKNTKTKLGWTLGFRQPVYTLTDSSVLSEAFLDLNGPRYLYLALDEFNNSASRRAKRV